MTKRLFSGIACVLLLASGRSAPSDTAAVRPKKIASNDLDAGRVWIQGQGLVPGLGFARWGASATRISFSDDPSYSQPQFDARGWAKADHLDSLDALDSSICWIRFQFKLDSSLDQNTMLLQMVVVGRAEIWLDGTLLLRHEMSNDVRSDQRAPGLDTTAFFTVPIPVHPDGKTHVLAMRLEAGQDSPPPFRSLRAGLHRPAAAAKMHRSGAHLAVFVGVNAFILIMALLFWRMDKHDRIWPWFAALTGTNAFIAFTDLLQKSDMGVSSGAVKLSEHAGDALRFTPFCLSVLLLVVILGQATRRSWRLYVGSAVIFSLVPATLDFLGSLFDDVNEIRAIIILLIIGLLALVPAGWFLVETIRLSVRVIRSRGFQRWIGAGVLIGSLVPILLPSAWFINAQYIQHSQNVILPEGLQTMADYIGYIALPLSIITALAIRTTHQNRMLARQRDDLDKEVHERTAELRLERDRSENLLLNILPHEVAEELKATGAAEAKHFDLATVMFTDFKGFTAMSEKVTPAELIAELNTCFKAFDDIIAKRGIEKIKTIGDAYMCAGGLPDPKSSAPIDVVMAALEMQEFMTTRCAQRTAEGLFAFEMRSGINTGPVVAGIVGVKKFQYDIWGDTVNMASRMETSGEVRRVNISEGTYSLVKDVPGLAFTPRGAVDVKGKGAAEMWFVRRSSDGA